LSSGTSSSAAAINDLGVVAGMADGPTTVIGLDGVTKQYCSDVNQAFVWTRAKGMQGLGTVGVGPTDDSYLWCNIISYASGINLLGQVVGTNDWAANTYQNGFLWTDAGGMTLLSPLPPSPQCCVYYNHRANVINNLGQIVGIWGCCDAVDEGHAVLWTNDGVTVTDLGTLGGADPDFLYCSEASDVNDARRIVGWSTPSPQYGRPCDTPTSTHAVLWTQGGGIQDLGTLSGDASSQAYRINLFGQVIGTSGGTLNYVYPPGRSILVGGRPFVWTNDRGMRDLNTLIRAGSGWVLNSVSDINIWGQIVGSGTLNGQSHGFLLTPKKFFQRGL
jgi:probable HAF family extracellular repeat protein